MENVLQNDSFPLISVLRNYIEKQWCSIVRVGCGCTGVGVRVWVCTGRRDCRNDLQFANHSDVPEVGLMEYVVS